MIIDAQALFSDAQALGAATSVSTNVIDLGSDRNAGVGEPMAVVVVIDVALEDGDGDETYVVTVQSGSTATPTDVIATATMTRGDVAGTKYVLPLPADGRTDRYLRVNYTLGGTLTAGGTVTTFLQPMSMIQNDNVYPDGITIS